jgi:hypothetical protein
MFSFTPPGGSNSIHSPTEPAQRLGGNAKNWRVNYAIDPRGSLASTVYVMSLLADFVEYLKTFWLLCG